MNRRVRQVTVDGNHKQSDTTVELSLRILSKNLIILTVFYKRIYSSVTILITASQ